MIKVNKNEAKIESNDIVQVTTEFTVATICVLDYIMQKTNCKDKGAAIGILLGSFSNGVDEFFNGGYEAKSKKYGGLSS